LIGLGLTLFSQVIYGIGISPRDELAAAAGIKVSSRGGIEVGDDLMTSARDVYAIGECASWQGNVRVARRKRFELR
jgi:nitrite reductase (NAD(P)H)